MQQLGAELLPKLIAVEGGKQHPRLPLTHLSQIPCSVALLCF